MSHVERDVFLCGKSIKTAGAVITASHGVPNLLVFFCFFLELLTCKIFIISYVSFHKVAFHLF